MVTQKEIKESNRDGVNMRKKMAHLKIVYKGPGLDHKATIHTPTKHKLQSKIPFNAQRNSIQKSYD